MNEGWVEKIEQYLQGELNEEEKLLFESEMKKKDELSSAFQIYKALETEMRTREIYGEKEQALKDSLAKLNEIYFSSNDMKHAAELNTARQSVKHAFKKKETRIFNPELLSIAAATIGITIISIVLYLKTGKENEQAALAPKKNDTGITITNRDTGSRQISDSSNTIAQNPPDTGAARIIQKKTLTPQKQEALFTSNFQPDNVPEITEGPLEDAFTLYYEKKYIDAAEEFVSADINKITRGPQTAPKLNAFYADYYAGISYLAKDESNKAISKLENALTKIPDEQFKIKVQWYLALAYLKKGESGKAEELLMKISADNTEPDHQAKATELLKELR